MTAFPPGVAWPTKQTVEALTAAGVAPAGVVAIIRAALTEDGVLDADGRILPDPTTWATIPADHVSTLVLRARRSGVVAGVPCAAAAFEMLGASAAGPGQSMVVRIIRADGAAVQSTDAILTVTGNTRTLLLAERTALNLLSHLSGIATLTAQWVAAVAGTGAVIRDTRKTTPGLRVLEKYAVRCGGGHNHRMTLCDAALIKDNHVAAAGGVTEAIRAVRIAHPMLPCEVEVDTLAQLDEALAAGAAEILLDNFDLPGLTHAVARVAGRARLEASGGLTLSDAAAVAATGVDFLAVGALTHSAPVLDIGGDLIAVDGGPDPD